MAEPRKLHIERVEAQEPLREGTWGKSLTRTGTAKRVWWHIRNEAGECQPECGYDWLREKRCGFMLRREAKRALDAIDLQQEGAPHVMAYLQLVAEGMRTPGPEFGPIEATVLQKGTVYRPHAYPASWKRGLPRNCYRNAADLMWKRTLGLTYVEGYAWAADVDHVTLHGWCVDRKGNVYDPTWDNTERNEYVGIPFNPAELSEWLSVSKHELPILDAWPAGFPYLHHQGDLEAALAAHREEVS